MYTLTKEISFLKETKRESDHKRAIGINDRGVKCVRAANRVFKTHDKRLIYDCGMRSKFLSRQYGRNGLKTGNVD